MAYAKITNAEVGLNGVVSATDGAGEVIKTYTPDFTMTAVSGGGFEIDVTNVADNKLVVLLTATAKGTATLKAGDMIQGVNDVDIDLTADKMTAVRVDSGAFKNAEGKIVITSSATGAAAAAIVLP